MDTSRNQRYIRTGNINLVLGLIREHGEISRVDIARLAGLSPAAVTDLTRQMMQAGLVEEKREGTARIGRKPILLCVNPDRGFVLAVTVADQIRVEAVTLGNRILTSDEIRADRGNGAAAVGPRMVALLRDTVKRSGMAPDALFGIAVSVSGIIGARGRRVIASSVTPWLGGIDLYGLLRDAFHVPVYIENIRNLSAFAEKRLVAEYAEKNSLVYLKVGPGIGAGAVVGGEIVRGAFGGAGEVGHIVVDPCGPACRCGSAGCLEAMANTGAVVRAYALEWQKATGAPLVIPDGTEEAEILRRIGDGARIKEPAALRTVEREARFLAAGVLCIINTYNPEVVVIGGEITRLGELLTDKIREIVGRTIFGVYLDRMAISFSRLEEDVELSGAALYAIDAFYKAPGELFPFRPDLS